MRKGRQHFFFQFSDLSSAFACSARSKSVVLNFPYDVISRSLYGPNPASNEPIARCGVWSLVHDRDQRLFKNIMLDPLRFAFAFILSTLGVAWSFIWGHLYWCRDEIVNIKEKKRKYNLFQSGLFPGSSLGSTSPSRSLLLLPKPRKFDKFETSVQYSHTIINFPGRETREILSDLRCFEGFFLMQTQV